MMDTNDFTADETLNASAIQVDANVSQKESSLPSNASDERLKMDSLLEKLRKGMIELSGQGDDFTKQMWNMYATFEDLISVPPKNDKTTVTAKEMTNDGHSECVDMPSNAIPKVEISVHREETSAKVSSKCFKVSMKSDEKSVEKNKAVIENEKSKIEMSELSPNIRTNLFTRKMKNTKSGYQSDSGSSSSVANPLLDTISSLTSSDPYSDSDDCCDLNGKAYQQRQRRRCRRMMNERNMKRSPNHHHHHSSSDADSIGYAGSNSIDSGYKSQCPTPEVPENTGSATIHASDATDRQKNVCTDNACKTDTSKPTPPTVTSKTVTSDMTIKKAPEPKQAKEETKTASYNTAALNSPKSRSPTKAKQASSSSKGGLYSAKIANRLKSQNTNAHLEHLLHLRQTLISAIQKCENAKCSSPPVSRVASPIVISSRSSSPASSALLRNNNVATAAVQPSSLLCNNRLSSVNKNKCLSPEISKHAGLSPKTVRKHYHLSQQTDLRCTVNSASPTSLSAAHNKSVRFDNDVQITSLYPLTLNARTSLKTRRKIETTAATEYADRSPFATKSILKDPLCANLRSQIETGELGSGCSLEGEIDSLLYGKVDGNYSSNYTVDTMQDIPYVTLIEDKYRLKQNSPNVTKMKETTVAFSRALETTEHFDDLDLITASEVNINATLSTKTRERTAYSGSTVSDRSRKLSKTKFTEMAKYMLDILDDLQSKKEDELKSDTGNVSMSVCEKLMREKSKISHSDTASETSYNTLPEYHIYEEVMYDCMDAIKQHETESRVQFNEPDKSLTKMSDLHTPIEKVIPALKQYSQTAAGSWGRRTYNRPKQRSNLYSLFSDSAQRRNISRSLEREWNYYRSNLIEDICKDKEIVVGEYGFKASI